MLLCNNNQNIFARIWLTLHIKLSDNEEVAEELLLALGPEGADTKEISEPIHPQLASRWQNIMKEGLKRETRDIITKKYPDPENFSTTAPSLNPEIKAIMSEVSIKRDNRLIVRQKLTGKVLTAMGKAMTSVMKGNFNSKQLIEYLSDSAKITADIYNQDLTSRKYFALAGTSSLVKDAIKNEKSDETLFGSACSEKIKLAQTIQRTGSQIKHQKNFKSPLPFQQKPRSGQYQYRQPVKTQQRPYKKRQIPQRKRSPPRKLRPN